MIDLNKKYKQRNGLPVKLFYIMTPEEAGDNRYVITGIKQLKDKTWGTETWTIEGSETPFVESQSDLIEIGPYDDFKTDDKVWAWDVPGEKPKKRYFSHVGENGKPYCFRNGATSWTSDSETNYWEHVKKIDEENEND